MPKITYRIPELDDTEFTASAGGDSIRGQSPAAGSWFYEQMQRAGQSVYRAFSGDEPAVPAADAVPMDIYLNLEDEAEVPAEGPCAAAEMPCATAADNKHWASSATQAAPVQVMGNGLLAPTNSAHLPLQGSQAADHGAQRLARPG